MAFKGTAGFIGAGKMGGILIEGIIRAGLLPKGRIVAYDAAQGRVAELADRLGIRAAESVGGVVESAGVVFLCVKPDQFGAIADPVSNSWDAGKPALVSIMAGVRTSRIREKLGKPAPLIRVMPNVACLIGQGVAGVAADPNAKGEINSFVFELFEALGGAVWVAESKLDAVTAVAGSGPAYVFMFIEALADAGVKLGLDRAVADKLALRTVAGASALAEQSELDTLQLRASVSSPGGTTVAATAALERAGFRGIIIDAVERACKRSIQLGS